MIFPATYGPILTQTPLPRMVEEGLKLYGTQERIGTENNPEILEWAKELGLNQYTADSIPWCGLFVAICAKRAGKKVVGTPLWARSWSNFGSAALAPSLGDVLVFGRDGGGHVGLYVAEDNACFHVLGGNQGDQVSIVRILKERKLAHRRPLYITQPSTVKPYFIAKHGGVVSSNEA